MAKRADSGWRALVSSVAELLAPAPGRLEYAARLALVCALTVLVVETYQTPDPALTAYLAFFVIKPDRASSAALGLVLVVVMTATLIMTLMVVTVVIDDPFRRVVAMTALSFCLLFAASASKLKPVAGIVALIVGYAVDLLGQIQIGEIATRALLYAWLFVAIPAGISVAVNMALGPAPRRLLEVALARRLQLSAAALRSADRETVERLSLSLREGASESPELLKAADLEGTSPPEDIAALRQACASTAAVQSLVDLAARDRGLLPAPERTRLARILDLMARFFATGRRPTGIHFAPDTEPADLTPLTKAMIAELDETLSSFAEPVKETASGENKPSKGGGFFLPDAFTNAIHVHYAIKTTAAAIVCYIAYQLMDWPGIHTCMITCFFVALTTVGETVHKGTLRLTGCIVGGVLGIGTILLLMPVMTDLGELLLLVAAVTFLAGWVGYGGERISYAGWQVAMAFYLSTFQDFGPTLDMATARDRIVGLVLGDLVILVIFTAIWPVSAARVARANLAKAVEQLSALFQTDEAEAVHRAAFVQSMEQARAVMVNEAFEPRAVLTSDGRRPIDGGILSQVQFLIVPVSVILDLRRETPGSITVATYHSALADWFQRAAAWIRDGDGAASVAESLPGPPAAESAGPLGAWHRVLYQDLCAILREVGPR